MPFLFQTLTSASRHRVPPAQPVWTRLTVTAASVLQGNLDLAARKVKPEFYWSTTTTWWSISAASLVIYWIFLFFSAAGRRCSVRGRIFTDGSRWDKGCNSCRCHNGRVSCTKVWRAFGPVTHFLPLVAVHTVLSSSPIMLSLDLLGPSVLVWSKNLQSPQ